MKKFTCLSKALPGQAFSFKSKYEIFGTGSPKCYRNLWADTTNLICTVLANIQTPEGTYIYFMVKGQVAFLFKSSYERYTPKILIIQNEN